MTAALILSLSLALLSYRFKALSRSGAVGTVVVGTIIFGFGGVVFAIPLLFFFISSSIFSHLKTPGKIQSLSGADKTGTRDFAQVMANGAAASALALVYFLSGDIIWFFPYLASLCEASADTWATELGTLHPDSPVSILSLKRVDPGQSGGISILGTVASIGGAIMTMLVARSGGLIADEFLWIDMMLWLTAACCGLAGSFLDSVLGASLQAQYRCNQCHRRTERRNHCGLPATLARGVRFVDNDFVNFAGTLFAALAATAIILLLGA
ncbi:MAG: hypothetical protein A2W25_02300 [candidate division Zixibacteria bacterium RBG_16_53_22]|nr:MAG: hypothetical protein A2W25_02300 [candidate division Zixibacteria bacterium RBG_16_53_22]